MKSPEALPLMLEYPKLEAAIVRKTNMGEPCEAEMADVRRNLDAQAQIPSLVSQEMGAFVEAYVSEKRALLDAHKKQDAEAWCRSMIEHSIQCLPTLKTLSQELKQASQ